MRISTGQKRISGKNIHPSHGPYHQRLIMKSCLSFQLVSVALESNTKIYGC